MTSQNKNLNNTYYKTLDENFNSALKLLENNLSHEELLNLLSSGNIAQKQIAALKLTKIENFEEANILVDNLIGQDGKIREVVALKILELIKQYECFFLDNHIYDVLLKALIDVNSNVCRNVISIIKILKRHDEFTAYFTPKLIDMTKEFINEVKKFNFQDGKYKINKEVFKLYWCLEVLYDFTDNIELKTLKDILKQSKSINEYTIREKTARILTKNFADAELISIREYLKKDSNYYVRRY